MSLRPCAENEFVALKKVREGDTGRKEAPRAGLAGLRTLGPKRVYSTPTCRRVSHPSDHSASPGDPGKEEGRCPTPLPKAVTDLASISQPMWVKLVRVVSTPAQEAGNVVKPNQRQNKNSDSNPKRGKQLPSFLRQIARYFLA